MSFRTFSFVALLAVVRIRLVRFRFRKVFDGLIRIFTHTQKHIYTRKYLFPFDPANAIAPRSNKVYIVASTIDEMEQTVFRNISFFLSDKHT